MIQFMFPLPEEEKTSMPTGFNGTGGRATIGSGGGVYGLQNRNHNNLRQQQIGGMGIDLSGQIANRRLDFVGKLPPAEFQSYPQIHHHLLHSQNRQHQTDPAISLLQQQMNLLRQQQNQPFLRSVKPRLGNYHNNNSSPISTLSPPVDLSPPTAASVISHLEMLPSSFSSPETHYGVPVYQHLRPNPISLTTTQNTASNQGTHFSSNQLLVTLQELEEQLLGDDEDEEAVSVVTDSEWGVEIQKLMGSAQQTPTPPPLHVSLISASPTSSSSSCPSTCSSSTSPLTAKNLISEAAAAIDEGRKEATAEILSRLSQVANSKGSPEQRLSFHMANALRSRAFPNENPRPVAELYSRAHMGSLHMLYDHSPCFKYGLLAANYVILETIASERGKLVHVVDFDLGDGGQYVNLVRAVADRQSQVSGGSGGAGAVSIPLRVAAVNTDLSSSRGGENRAMEARDRLLKVAEQARVRLRIDVVGWAIHELTRESLGCEEEEAVVVNLRFKLCRVPDESVSMENLRDELLRRVKGLKPRVVTLVEQEMNLNTATFLTRVGEVSGYFGAVLESMAATKGRDDPDRLRMEEAMGRSVANAVACEGKERVERCEVFRKWRARMGMAGFDLRPLDKEVVESMRRKLGSGRGGNGGLTVKEEGGGAVSFGWNGRTLTVASAWR